MGFAGRAQSDDCRNRIESERKHDDEDLGTETGVGNQALPFKHSQAIEDRAAGTVNNIHFHQGANQSVHLSTRVCPTDDMAGCGVGEHVLLPWGTGGYLEEAFCEYEGLLSAEPEDERATVIFNRFFR